MRRILPSSGSAPARWSAVELALIALSVLLLVVALGSEAYRWVNPRPAPAAPASQAETATSTSPPADEAVTETLTPSQTATPSEIAAPSATEAPATPAPPTAPPTATSTPFAGEPPLTLIKSVSQPQALIGDAFSYALTLGSTNEAPLDATVRDRIDPQLLVTGATTSNGACRIDGVVLCDVRVQRGSPVQIRVDVVVRRDARPGTQAVSQATARDAAYNSAASDPVGVLIAAPALRDEVSRVNVVTPTATLVAQAAQEPQSAAPAPPSQPQHAQPSAQPREEPPAPTATPAEAQAVAQALTVAQPDAVAPAAAAAPVADTSSASAPVLSSAPAQVSVAQAPAKAAPSQNASPPEAPRRQTVTLLPHTASLPVIVGFAVALFGLALTLRAIRRVRAADALLAARSVAVGDELTPLVRAAQQRQRTSAAMLAAMRQQSQRIAALLRQPGDRRPTTDD